MAAVTAPPGRRTVMQSSAEPKSCHNSGAGGVSLLSSSSIPAFLI